MQYTDLLIIDYAIIILSIIVLYMFLAPVIRRKLRGDITYIKPEELKRLVTNEDDVLVIDVRRKSEFEGVVGHIQGAINIPVADLQNKLNQKASSIMSLIDADIVIVGFGKTRDSLSAYSIFKTYGFANISLLEGGILAWTKNKFPTEKKSTGA